MSGVLPGAVAQVVARIIGMAFGLATTMIVSRYLGVSDYGSFQTVLAFWALFNLASEMGVSAVVSAEIARPNASRADVWFAGMLCQLIYSAIAAVAGLLLAPVVFMGASRTASAAALGFVLIFSSLPAVNAAHQVRLKMWIPALVGIGQSAGILALALAGVLAHAGWPYFVVTNGLVSVALIGLSVYLGWRAMGRPTDRLGATTRTLLKSSLSVGVAGLFATLYFKVDTILVYRVLGSTSAGVYGAAYRLYEIGLLVPTAVMSAAIPVAVSLRHRHPDEYADYAGSVLQTLLTAGLLFAILGAALSRLAVGIIFGSAFDAATLVFVLLLPGLVARYVSVWLGTLLISIGRRKEFLRIAMATSVVAIGLYWTLIPVLGVTGAAGLTSLIELSVTVVTWGVLGDSRPSLRWTVGGTSVIGLVGWGAGSAVSLLPPASVWRFAAVGVCILCALSVARLFFSTLSAISHKEEVSLVG